MEEEGEGEIGWKMERGICREEKEEGGHNGGARAGAGGAAAVMVARGSGSVADGCGLEAGGVAVAWGSAAIVTQRRWGGWRVAAACDERAMCV